MARGADRSPSGARRVSTHEIGWAEHAHGETFAHRRKSLTRAVGSERLGCSLYEVPPGRRAWPYHYHLANEEAILVLEGSGVLRTPEGEVAIGAGDYLLFPAGEAGAHAIRNPTDAPLRYLALSTMTEPDVTVYPDSNKLGVFAGSAPGGPSDRRTMNRYLSLDAEVGYYEGEGEETS